MGAPKRPEASRAYVGREVLRARRQQKPEPWKALQRRFGYGRARLWMLMREAEAAEKSVYRHIRGCNSEKLSVTVGGQDSSANGDPADDGDDHVVSKVFGGAPKVAAPAAAPAVAPGPSPEEMAAQETARRKEIEASRKAKGRSATLLTGGQGVTGAAPVQRKQLLGA